MEIVGMGAMNIDRIYRVSQMLSDGEAAVEEFQLSPGGSAANTIYGLAKLGVEAGFVGVVGDDPEGQWLMEDLRSVGVDTSQIKAKSNVPTGTVLCLSDKQGRRALYVLPGANSLLSRADIDLAYLNRAKIWHLSSFAQRSQLDMQIALAGELALSVKISFAPGALYCSQGFQRLASLLRRTQVLFLNRDELKQLTGQDIPTGAQRCLELGCGIVVVTLGGGVNLEQRSASSYINDGQQEYWVESAGEKVDFVADAIGAGDAFAAGFLYGLLRGKNLGECGRLGDILARFSLSRVGARAGLPTLAQLSQQL